jgi:nucleotide-binding universal stress UspA family protein
VEPVRLSTEWLTVELFSPPKRDRWEALHRLRMRQANVPIEPVMRKGAPAEVSLDVAREVPCDLIVMGVPGQAEERSPVLSDVAAEVVGKAPCPVLTLTVPRPLPPAAPRR